MKQFYKFFKALVIPIFIFGFSAIAFAQPAATSGEPFSIIVLPDAQNYTASLFGGTPSMFTSQTQWCVNNQASSNIKYVGMVGDLTNFGMSWEWSNANNSMSKLDAVLPGVPFGVVPGNHDLFFGTGTFNSYFGVSRFQGRSYYGGHYGTTNENHYDLISSNGMDFIIICIGSGDQVPGTGVLNWADALLKSNPTKRGILINHSLMYAGMQASFTSPGQAIYTALKDNPNLFLMICGHEFGSGYRTDIFEGRTIYTMIADYQNESNGGNGWLRIAEFDPFNNVIHMTTYSTTLNSWKTSANDKFDLAYEMKPSVLPLPLAYSLTGSGSYCQGSGGLAVGLAGSQSGVTYTLYKAGVALSPTVPGTGNAISFGTQLAGTYTVSGTNTTGTTNMTGTAIITENPAITISGTVTDAACSTSNGAITISVTGGTLPVTAWNWSGPNGYSSTMQNISGLAAGTYTVTATDSKSCTGTNSFNVQSGSSTILASVSALNNGTVFRTSPTYTSADAIIYITGKTGNFGLSSQVKLTAAASGGSGTYTYTWSPSTGLNTTTGSIVTAKPSVTTTYTVTVKDSKGCTATQIKTVTVNNIRCTSNRKSGVWMCVLNSNGTRSSKCVLLTNTSVLNNSNNLFGSCSATVAYSIGTELLSAAPTDNFVNASIKAYPNPTGGSISLELSGFAEGKARINLYCSDGSLAMQKDVELAGDQKIIALDLSNLSNGVYIVQLVHNNGTMQTIIIKQ